MPISRVTRSSRIWCRLIFQAAVLLALGLAAVLAYQLAVQPGAAGPTVKSPLVRGLTGLLVGPAAVVVGTAILRRDPRNAIGRILVLFAVGLIGFQLDFDLGDPVRSSAAFQVWQLYFVGAAIPFLFCLLTLFPTGRAHPPVLARWIPAYVAAQTVATALSLAAEPGAGNPAAAWSNPFFVPTLAPYAPLLGRVGGLGVLLALGLLAGGASLWLRHRAADAVERAQIRWLLWGGGVYVATALIHLVVGRANPAATNAALVLLAAGQTTLVGAVGIAVLRHRLFDVDRLISRTIVYAALSLGIVGVYAATVAILSAALRVTANTTVALVGTAVVALAFQPARGWLQRRVDRLLYGQRDDPYGVLERLGQRMDAVAAPGAVLAAVAETTAQALKAPYAAVLVERDGAFVDAARWPADADRAERDDLLVRPLVHQHETVGQLVVAPRAAGERFGGTDQRLIDELARRAAAAVHAVRLAGELRRSRDRAVAAREEERRRIRRDLHDGLGPVLAGMAMKVGAARDLLRADPDRAGGLLAEAEEHARASVADVRRLVYGLRPPVLDEVGLVGAVREQARRAEQATALRVSVRAEELPSLPAAVEVAAYCIAGEAVANAARHAGARSCAVDLSVGADGLTVEVTDDGVGLPPDYRAGVGLVGMRERAAEVGGWCAVERCDGGGTRVVAELPLGDAAVRHASA